METLFTEASEFYKSYDILLTKFRKKGYNIINESTNLNMADIESAIFKTSSSFIDKVNKGYETFLLKARLTKRKLISKQNVEFLINTLYQIPPDLKIMFPDFEKAYINEKIYYKKLQKLTNNLYKYDYITWVTNIDPFDIIDEIIDLGKEYREKMDETFLFNLTEVPVKKVIPIVTEICYTTGDILDGRKIHETFLELGKYLNITSSRISQSSRLYQMQIPGDIVTKTQEKLESLSKEIQDQTIFSANAVEKINNFIIKLADIMKENQAKEITNDIDLYKLGLIDAKHMTRELDDATYAIIDTYRSINKMKKGSIIDYFESAEKFKNDYGYLLNKSIKSYNIMTEDGDLSAQYITTMKNMQDFINKLERGYKIFNLKIKQIKNETLYKKRVDFLLETLYKLPKDTMIPLPDIIGWQADLHLYYKAFSKNIDKLCSYPVTEWVDNDNIDKIIDKLINICIINKTNIHKDLHNVKKFKINEAILIVSQMNNDPELYTDMQMYRHKLLKQVEKNLSNLKQNEQKAFNEIPREKMIASMKTMINLEKMLKADYDYITDVTHKIYKFICDLSDILMTDGPFMYSARRNYLVLMDQKMNKLIDKFNTNELDYASKDLMNAFIKDYISLDPKTPSDLSKKYDLNKQNWSTYNLK